MVLKKPEKITEQIELRKELSKLRYGGLLSDDRFKKQSELLIDKAQQAITKLVEGLIGDKKIISGHESVGIDGYKKGYNQRGQEIRQRLGKEE